ncbi:MAG: serine--tRNA ligase, partial [Gammaproteobacteria bacterium]|nr:serine--tRNA ligase [Gammaproteobacteria bacterium]
MLDPRLLRNDLENTASKLKRRGVELDTGRIAGLESQRKKLQIDAQELQNQRNSRSKGIGKAKAAGEDIKPLLDEVADLGDRLKGAQDELKRVQDELQAISMGIPNIPDESVPDGRDEADNREEARWGEPPVFDFDPLDHVDLGTGGGWLDFEAATKITGSRFVTLQGSLARMQRALAQFMLDTHTQEHGYTETYVPFMVNADSLRGTGQLPKFEEDLFKLSGEFGYYLIPTAEVPITNLVRDEIIDDKKMPQSWVAQTPCFRSEAGSYGRDTRGMIRQHQFEKVEMVQVVRP